MWYLPSISNKENAVSETFRERIKHTIHDGPEHVSSWRRLGWILLSILCVEIWIAAAGTLTATSLLMFVRAVPTTIHTIPSTELTMILPLAMIIASAAVAISRIPPDASLARKFRRAEDGMVRFADFMISLVPNAALRQDHGVIC